MHDDEFVKKHNMDGYMGQQQQQQWALNGYEGFHTGVFLSCFLLFYLLLLLLIFFLYYKHRTASQSICGIWNRRRW